MRPDQITAIRQSIQQLLLNEDMLVALFYERLFVLEPSLKDMFGSDMRAQGRKFMTMLQFVVAGLDNPDLSRDLHSLGQRHREYGVRPEHYATVQAALQWALEQALHEHYTTDVDQVWAALYDLVASAMQENPAL